LPSSSSSSTSKWRSCSLGGGVRKLGATGLVDGGVLAVLTIGFAYEWKKGALEWD